MTTNFTIPPAAAAWIASNLNLPESKAKELASSGLSKLTVAELRIVWDLLKPLCNNNAKQDIKRTALKPKWCQFIQSLFYKDPPLCRVCDDDFCNRMVVVTAKQNQPQGTTTSGSTTLQPQQQRQQQQQQQQQPSISLLNWQLPAPPPAAAATTTTTRFSQLATAAANSGTVAPAQAPTATAIPAGSSNCNNAATTATTTTAAAAARTIVPTPFPTAMNNVTPNFVWTNLVRPPRPLPNLVFGNAAAGAAASANSTTTTVPPPIIPPFSFDAQSGGSNLAASISTWVQQQRQQQQLWTTPFPYAPFSQYPPQHPSNNNNHNNNNPNNGASCLGFGMNSPGLPPPCTNSTNLVAQGQPFASQPQPPKTTSTTTTTTTESNDSRKRSKTINGTPLTVADSTNGTPSNSDLVSSTLPPPPPPTTAAAATTTTTTTTTIQVKQEPGVAIPPRQHHPFFLRQPEASPPPTSPQRCSRPHQHHHQPQQQKQQQPALPLAQSIPNNSSSNNNNNANTTNNDNVSETQPSTPRERQLTVQLQQMGFTDMREVLNGIRTLQSNRQQQQEQQQQQQQEQNSTVLPPTSSSDSLLSLFSNTSLPSQQQRQNNNHNNNNNNSTAANEIHITADEVMMWLIQQREEEEEARKMDAARLHSEMLRKEAADRRQAETQRQYMDATCSEWLSSERMFAHSWLLRHATLQTMWWRPLAEQRGSGAKQALIDLLLVEKQARQWYGQHLPYCYFTHTLCERFLTTATSFMYANDEERTNVMTQALKEQVQVLKTGMFTLSEQQGGVPRIFLQAEQDAVRQGLPTTSSGGGGGGSGNGNSDDDDDDDDVVEILDQLPPRPQSQFHQGTPTSPDVIEIS